MHLLRGGKSNSKRRRLHSEITMKWSFFQHIIRVPLKLSLLATKLVALLSERPSHMQATETAN